MRRRVAALGALMSLGVFAWGCGDTTTVTAPTVTSPSTSSFTSTLAVAGAVSRQFTATQSGTVSVTLNSAGPASTVVGLGIGVPTAGIANCSFLTTSRATAGTAPQIAASVDAGPYCVGIYDVGTLTAPISFDITIVYP
jgi:hypothetical protein